LVSDILKNKSNIFSTGVANDNNKSHRETQKKHRATKNKLKQLETSLNAQERKKRTRKLIEIGGLLQKPT
jgi:hypothetical protein